MTFRDTRSSTCERAQRGSIKYLVPLLGGLRLASEEPLLECLGIHNLTGRLDQFHAQRSAC